MKSLFLKLKTNDFVKGLIVAMLAAIITSVYSLIQQGSLQMDWLTWKPIFLTAVGAGLSYIIKNFFSNSDGQFLKKENNTKIEINTPLSDGKTN